MHVTAKLPAIIANLPLVPFRLSCHRIVDFATLTGFNPIMPLYTLGAGITGQRYTPKGGPSALYVAEDRFGGCRLCCGKYTGHALSVGLRCARLVKVLFR
jgi:hypothetical protein